MLLLDQIGNRLGDAAGYSKATARAGALVQPLTFGDGSKVDFLCLEHTHQLLEGQHKVHIGADVLPDGLQLLGGAGAHKDHLAAGVLLLHQPGGEDHGGQSHGDFALFAGEKLTDHGVPRGAAGGCHVVLLGRDLLQKVLGFLDGAHVRADGHLHHGVEAQHLHGGHQLAGGNHAAELADEGGSHDGNDLVALEDGLNDLENLALVHDGAEGAGHQALAAGHTLVLIDDSPSVLVRADGVHAAGGLTGAL